MNTIDVRKLLRANAPLVYQDLVLRDPNKRIPDETSDDFIKDMENYQKELDAKEAKRQEESTWKKL